jgi:hypothetical protein
MTMKIALTFLALLLPSAYAQDLCQSWTIPSSPQRPFSGLVFSSSAKTKGVEAFMGNTWQLLPSQNTAPDKLEWLVPLADPDRGGQIKVRALVSAQTNPTQPGLQICPEKMLTVSALPASGVNSLSSIHAVWQKNLATLKTSLGAFGEYTLPETTEAGLLRQFPAALQPIILLELLLRSKNNLEALAGGSAPALDGLTAEQKTLLTRVLQALPVSSPAPLKLSPPRPLFTIPNNKKALPDLESVLFKKNQNLSSLYYCTQDEMIAAQLRDCLLWQKELSSWNSSDAVYKNNSYKVLGAMSLLGIVVPPVATASAIVGLSVYLHQLSIEAMDGLFPSSLEPLKVNMPLPPLFEDVENAPSNPLPLLWQEPIEVVAKNKGYKLNALAIGDGLLNSIGYSKLLLGAGKSARVFGRDLGATDTIQKLGDAGSEAVKAVLAEAGLNQDIQDALPGFDTPAKTIKSALLRPESLDVFVQPADGTFVVKPQESAVDYFGLRDRDRRNFSLTFESEEKNNYFPNGLVARAKLDLSVPKMEFLFTARASIKPGESMSIAVRLNNAYLKDAMYDPPAIGELSGSYPNFTYTVPVNTVVPQAGFVEVKLTFRHKTRGDITDFFTVRIVTDPRIVLSPAGGCITSQGKRQLKAQVFDLQNPKLSWRVLSGSGTISQSGLYTAMKNPPIQEVVIQAIATGTAGGTARTVTQTLRLTVGKCTCFAEFSTRDGQFVGRTIYFDQSGGVLRLAGPITWFTPQNLANQSITSAVQQSIIFGATLQGGRVSSNSIVVFNNLKYNWNGKQLLRSIIADPRDGADVRYTISKQTPERLEGSLSGTWVTKDFDRVEKWSEDGTTPKVWGKVFARLDFIAVRGELVAGGLTVGGKDVGKCLK